MNIYELIKSRRDVRNEFLSKPLPDALIMQLLEAAHYAPSVGYQQPWNFILIRDKIQRQKVQNIFKKASNEESEIFDDEKRALYHQLKLEGITKAPLNIVVTCDESRDGKTGLGRFHNPQMSAYSCVCAIQNLWLAARANNVGVGWVSIYHEADLRSLLKIPPHIKIIAYLCIGYVSSFYERPELEEKGWRDRLKLDDLIFQETWPDQ